MPKDVDRLYITRKEGGGGLTAIEDCAELEVRGWKVYVYVREERLIQTATVDRGGGLEVASVLKKAKKEKTLKDWAKKALHGQYLRQIFHHDLKKIYPELNGNGIRSNGLPNAEECTKFWNNIWGVRKEHNREAEWLKDLKRESKRAPSRKSEHKC